MTTMETRFLAAQPLPDYLAHVGTNAERWRSIHSRAQVPTDLLDRATALPGRWHLLVLVEDWCGDAINTVPVLDRLAELAPNIDLRVVCRDQNLDLMDAHLSPTGGRAIPVVLLLDEIFTERAWWGSRPEPLQTWINDEGHALPKDERYKAARVWYARDRGRTTLTEITAKLETAAATPINRAA